MKWRQRTALRLSLQDKSDLRTNAAFLRAIDRLTYLRVDSAVIVNNALSDAHIPRIESLRTDSQRVRATAIEATEFPELSRS